MRENRLTLQYLKNEVGLLFEKNKEETYEFHINRINEDTLFSLKLETKQFRYREKEDTFSIITENSCFDFKCTYIDFYREYADTIIKFTVDIYYSVLMRIKFETPELRDLKYKMTEYSIQCGNEYL